MYDQHDVGAAADSSSDSLSVLSMTNRFPSVINLNVGGHLFATRLSTLLRHPDSMLAAMFSGRHQLDTDPNGNFFIDRDGQYFGHVLNYLRHDDLPPANVSEAVLRDAVYYGLTELADLLRNSPALFAEYVVRENMRQKLNRYEEVKEELTAIARNQAVKQSSTVSAVRLVITKNQPLPRDLQFSKQVYKQFFRRFRIFSTFEAAFGRHYLHVEWENVQGPTDSTMDVVATCLGHDLCREGYKCQVKGESVCDDCKNKVITREEDEFRIVTSCHLFTFNWLESEHG